MVLHNERALSQPVAESAVGCLTITDKPLTVFGHNTTKTHCTRRICSRCWFRCFFTQMSTNCVPWRKIDAVTSASDVVDLVPCRKKTTTQFLWQSQPLECTKEQSNSEWCFHFNCSKGLSICATYCLYPASALCSTPRSLGRVRHSGPTAALSVT